jgi:hypothetical protein
MQSQLEALHKIIGAVCGEICMSLTLHRVSGGRATLTRWASELRRAAELIEKLIQ